MFPNRQPAHKSDTIHEASSIVIFPDGNGVLSDVSNKVAGLANPSVIPNAIVNKFTVN